MSSEAEIVLHVDATGSIVSAPEDVMSRIYLYVACVALIILEEDQKLILPLLEMISSAHNTFTIFSWLEEFRDSFIKRYNKPSRISKLVTDFSFAILSAASKAFYNQNLIEFINSTYSSNGKKISSECEYTKIHICCNHFMKTSTKDINIHFPINKSSNVVRVFIKETLGLMFNLTTIESLEDTFRFLSIIFNSKYVTEAVMSAISYITSLAKTTDMNGHRTGNCPSVGHNETCSDETEAENQEKMMFCISSQNSTNDSNKLHFKVTSIILEIYN